MAEPVTFLRLSWHARMALVSILGGLFIILGFIAAKPAQAAVITWDGGGVTNNWSEDANWSGDVEPGTSDVATFNATSTKAATIDTVISVQGIDINTGYSGTITQASGVTVTVGSGNFDISSGTFTGGDSTITMNAGFSVTGGTFTSTTGTLVLDGAVTISSGSFEPSTGSVTFQGGTFATNVNVTETFNNVTVSMSHGAAMTITSGDTLIVTGTLTLTDGILNTGTMEAQGSITQASTFDGGTSTLDFGGAGSQTYTINGGTGPVVELDSAADASDNIVFATAGNLDGLTITSGFSGTIPITNASDVQMTFWAWTQAAGTFSGGSFSNFRVNDLSITGGTFTAPTTVLFEGGASTFNVNSTQTLNNLTVNINSASATTLSSGDIVTVTGTFTHTDGVINRSGSAIIKTQGPSTVASTADGGNCLFDFDSASAQTLTINGGSVAYWRLDSSEDASDSIVVNAAFSMNTFEITSGFSGTVPITNAGAYALTLTTFTQAAGTFNGDAFSTISVSDLTISGGTFVAPTTTIFTGLSPSANVNSTQTFNNITLNTNNGGAMALGSGDTLTVTGTLALNEGQVNNGTIKAQGTITYSSNIDGGSTIIDFDGAGAQTLTISGGTFPVLRFDAAADASDSVTVSGAATFNGFTTTSDFSGTVPFTNSGDNLITFSTLTLGGGTFDLSATSSVNMGDFVQTGSAVFTAPVLVTFNQSVSPSYTVDVNQTFNDVTLNASSANLAISSGDTLLVTDDYVCTNGSTSTGTLEVRGDVTLETGCDTQTAPLLFSGSATQTFSDATTGNSIQDADVTVNKSGGQVNQTSTIVMNAANTDLVIQEGKYNVNGQTLTVNGSTGVVTVEDGGNFQLQGAETFTFNASQPTLNSGSTVTYTGNGNAGANTYALTTLKTTYHHLVINSTDGATDVFQPGTTLDVNGDLTITAGNLDAVSGQNYAITVGGNWTNSGTFTARSGTVTLDPSTAHTLAGATTWYNLTMLENTDNATNTTITFPSGVTQTITGTLTLDGLDASDKLLIAASTPTSAATIDFTGSSTFSGDNLVITDNTATDNSSGVSLPLNPASSSDGGNTTGWLANASITVSAISGNTTEAAGTATFTVVLDAAPSDNVVVTSATSDSTEGTVTSGSSLTFTTGNWSTPQTVTVTGVNDDIDDGDVAYTIQVDTDDTNTLDANYDGVDPNDVAVTNTDNDTAGITVSAISGNTTEAAGTAMFTVVLNTEPTGSVEVDSSSSDSTEGTVTGGSTLTFTTVNWATPQTVTVTGVNDSIDDGDIAYTIQTSTDDTNTADAAYDAIDPNDVSVTNTDNDTAGVTVSAISRHTTEAGQTATFTVVLNTLPTANVEVDSVSSDETEGIVTTGATLTFTTLNWNSPQTVTVTGQDDELLDGDIAYTIQTSTDNTNTLDNTYDAVDPNDVSVTNDDNEEIGVTVSTISGNTTEAGGTATFTVQLSAPPTGNVQIDSVSSDSTEGTVTSGSTLTFTTVNWATPQTVTVTGVDDALDDGNVIYSIQTSTNDAGTADNTYDAIDPDNVSVTNTDNDEFGISVSTISGNTTEAGGTATFTVVLNAQPADNVQVDSVSSDSTEGTVTSGSTLTFTTENWNTPQTVTVTGVDDGAADGNVAYSIVTTTNDAGTLDDLYDAVNPSDVAVTNTNDDVAGASLVESGGDSAVAEEGATSDTFTLALTSQPTASVTVNVSVDADLTRTPTSLTFTTENWSTPQTVTVTAVDDGTVETDPHPGVVSFSFSSGDAAYNNFSLSSLIVDVDDNDVNAVTVSAISGFTTEAGGTASFTVVLGAQPTSDVTITLSSNDTTEGVLTSSSTLTFTDSNWNTPQTVTLQGQDDEIDDGSVLYTIVLNAAVSLDLAFNGINPADVNVFNTDNDVAGITMTESSGTTVVDELGATSDTYTLVLTSEPTSNVVVTLTIDEEQIELDAGTVTFTSLNWDTPQTVTVTAVDDSDDEAAQHLTEIEHAVASSDGSYNNFNLAGLTVTVLDNDRDSSSGGGAVQTFVTAASVEAINLPDACESTGEVTLVVRARGAVRIYLSNDPDFLTEVMYDFTPDPALAEEDIEVMHIPWTFTEATGDHTVYAIFISNTNNRLPVIPTPVSLGVCDQPIVEAPVVEVPTVPAFERGISPYDGVTIEEVDDVAEGEAFKGEHYQTVYVLENGKRRPYLNESTFFTWHTDFSAVRTVTDVTLTAYPIGSPILPRPGRVLVKIDSSPEVYIAEAPNVLRYITSESDAEMLLGPSWDMFVITLPPTIFTRYVIGLPFEALIPWDLQYFFMRMGLQANDADRDGLTNDQEEILGTDPLSNDSDGDKLPDYLEVEQGTDPLRRN